MRTKDATERYGYEGELSGFQFVQLDGIESDFVLVTPELAADWLDNHNTKNRSFKRFKLINYARDMASGEWDINGESIVFTNQGVISDGQHRLRAIVESGEPQYLLVVYGVNPETQATVDTGSARQVRDQLCINGMPLMLARGVAATATRLLVIEQSEYLSNRTTGITHSEIMAFIDAHKEELIRAGQVFTQAGKLNLPAAPSGVAAAYYKCAEVDLEQAEQFVVAQVVEGMGLLAGDPAYALRQRFATFKKHATRNMEAAETYSFVIWAWNIFRAGRQAHTIQGPNKGFKTYPQPE